MYAHKSNSSPEKQPQFYTFTVNRFGSDLIRAFFVGTKEDVSCIRTKVWSDDALGLLVSYCAETKPLKKWILSLISLCVKFKVCVNHAGESSHSM